MKHRTTLPALPAFALLASFALVAGCTIGGDDTNDDVADDDRSGSVQPVTPTWIDGLRVINDSSNDPACPWATSYPDVPGAAALSAALEEEVVARRDNFLAAEPGSGARTCAEDLSGTELNVSFDFLVASGDVVGVSLTADYAAIDGSLVVESFWYDGERERAVPATAVVAEDQMGAFVAAVTERLSGREGLQDAYVRDVLRDARDTVLADLAFARNGDLVVTFGKGTLGTPAAGVQRVVLARAEADPLLSDFGVRAQRQTMDPDQRLDLSRSDGGDGGDGGDGETSGSPEAPAEPAVDCGTVKCIALTFDDGPGPYTGELLDSLAEYGARATFFDIGQNAAASPDLVRRQHDEGHEIGNHTWNHPDLTQLAPQEVQEQLDRTSQAIQDVTGQAPSLLRPPYGAQNDSVRQQAGMPLILWNLDTEDWKYRDSDHVTNAVLGTVQPGDIVLMHDIHETTVAAVPGILDVLADQGYHFVTVSELYADADALQPGGLYYSR